ncbi:MAG: DUF5668 domain-containing protein [Acidobacteriota bacterium]
MDNDLRSTEKKHPGLAAVISALFPGSGLFYVGNYVKGFSYLLIFVLLIVLLVNTATDGRQSMIMEIIIFSLLLAGFYVFQIIDSYNEAKLTGSYPDKEVSDDVRSEISLTGSIIILILGVLFLMRNLELISYRNIIKLWPLFLIGVGLKIVIEFLLEKENDNEQEK